MITVSVPGKVHLMGEHAVVYGKPAILAAINMRMRVMVEGSKDKDPITIVSKEPIDYARYAATFLLKQLKLQNPEHITITIDSDIPAGYHLGSSAAMAVGVAGGVMDFFLKNFEPIRINKLV